MAIMTLERKSPEISPFFTAVGALIQCPYPRIWLSAMYAISMVEMPKVHELEHGECGGFGAMIGEKNASDSEF